MRVKSLEIGLRELAGSFGGYGTILPLVMGYIVVCRLDPAGVIIMLGLTNICLGAIYRLPLPLEPMKVLAVMAIAQVWSPSLIYASGFAMGIIWLILAGINAVNWIRRITPEAVVRGIQLALAVFLFMQAVKMLVTWLILGAVSIMIVLILRKSRHAPAGLVLIGLGIFLIYYQGHFEDIKAPAFHLPRLTMFNPDEIWQSLLLGGFAQLPLTMANAIIVTAAMIKEYWHERVVSERKLAFNHGIINTLAPLFGGMPMCHGAGGLAGKYAFGARTGGASIMEGLIEVTLGLFFAASLAGILTYFPQAILGAMLLFASWELAKFARGSWKNREILILGVTFIGCVIFNMALGFLMGLLLHYLLLFKKNPAGRRM